MIVFCKDSVLFVNEVVACFCCKLTCCVQGLCQSGVCLPVSPFLLSANVNRCKNMIVGVRGSGLWPPDGASQDGNASVGSPPG